MALSVWDPFTALSRLDRDFDELVRRAWKTPTGTRGFVPAAEVAADGEDVVLRLELPGIDVEKDIDITVADGRLTISGRRTDRYETGPDSSEQGEKGRVLVRELRYGAFRRDFALPEGVAADDVEASYDRGMLEIRVHRATKPVAAPTKVAIRNGSSAE
jgi:HSP20 family protein